MSSVDVKICYMPFLISDNLFFIHLPIFEESQEQDIKNRFKKKTVTPAFLSILMSDA